jgi:hypothetical protein
LKKNFNINHIFETGRKDDTIFSSTHVAAGLPFSVNIKLIPPETEVSIGLQKITT